MFAPLRPILTNTPWLEGAMAKADFLSKPAAEAKAKGQATFTIDQPCKNGHLSPRYVSSKCCVSCTVEMKANRREGKPWRERDQKSTEARSRKSRSDYRRGQHNGVSATAEYKREAHLRWREKNREKLVIEAIERRAKRMRAMPSWADREAITEVYREARLLREMTGIPHHVDHIVPLRGANVCGLHVHWNLKAIPAAENQRKSNKFNC